MTTQNRPAATGGNGSNSDGAPQAITSIIPESPPNFHNYTIQELLTERARLDAVQRTTTDNDVWCEAFITWCELAGELYRRGWRAELPEPGRDGWQVAK